MNRGRSKHPAYWAIAVVAVVAVVGCSKGDTNQVNMSALAREAVDTDQRYREEQVRVLRTPPAERDLTALYEFLATEDFRAGAREYYLVDLADGYGGPEEGLSVVGQKVEELSDVSVRVTTCEAYRIQTIYLDGSTGMNKVVRRGVTRVWTRQADGVFRLTEGVPSRTFCEQF